MISKRKWSIYGAVALFHGVMILFYQVPFHQPTILEHELPASPVVMAAGTTWDPIIKSHPMVRNPLLMAQANERGFTRELWSKSFESPNPYNDWTESPRYLSTPNTSWGASFGQYADQTSQAMWKPLSKPRATLNQPLPDHPLHPTQTQMQFSKNLEDRLPKKLPELEAWNGSQPLESTHLQIGIHPLGFVQSVRIVDSPSPNPNERDFVQKAIRKFKTMMFRRDLDWNANSPAPLEWGDVEIQWLHQSIASPPKPQTGNQVR